MEKMTDKDRQIAGFFFRQYVEHLICKKDLVSENGNFTNGQLEIVARKLKVDVTNLHSAIALCCSRISGTALPRKISEEEEEKVWHATIKEAMKKNHLSLYDYQYHIGGLVRQLRENDIKTNKKQLVEFFKPLYMEALEEVMM